MDGNVIKNIKEAEIDESVFSDMSVSDEASYFSKIIYFLTLFLDGKEINDLLTQLINCFENIGSFYEILESENLPATFVKRYEIFNDCTKISEELRVINSFARMVEKSDNAKKIMFKEAAELLGCQYNDDESLSKYVDIILEKEDENGRKKTGFRNFIANNVIESSRFNYLVRYGNPKKLKKLSGNRTVIDFVLKGIPDAQIMSYYKSCVGTESNDVSVMRDALANIITGLSFENFENVKQDKNATEQEKKDKLQKQNIIRLYLTVLYLLVKNLVYVNSRYFLAFHCAERDKMLCTGSESYTEEDRITFAVDFVKENSHNTRARRYIENNAAPYFFSGANSGDDEKMVATWPSRLYRNTVEHLNAIRNMDIYINDIRYIDSYFELYHYLVQRKIMSQLEYERNTPSSKNIGEMIIPEEMITPRFLQYFELVDKYNTYCKDLVKVLNVPFAYNLARYKNLSINELFDRNNYLPKEAEKMEIDE